MFSATVIGVITVTALTVKFYIIKKRQPQPSSVDERDVVEMQKCEAYNTTETEHFPGHGCEVGMENNPAYEEVDAVYETCN